MFLDVTYAGDAPAMPRPDACSQESSVTQSIDTKTGARGRRRLRSHTVIQLNRKEKEREKCDKIR